MVNQETDLEGLWQIIEETHKVNTVSKVQSVTKKAARAMYQKMRQGVFASIITYKERFNAALKGYEEQKNSKMEEKDIAMDFFEGLDNARYASFKTEIMNGLTSKAIEQPQNLTESGEEKKKREKDLSKIKCYACGKTGHYATKCPSKEPKKDENENEEQDAVERHSHLT